MEMLDELRVSFKSSFLFPGQNLPLQLLPGPQRGALEAAAQAGAASALVAQTGAAESEIAPVGRNGPRVTVKQKRQTAQLYAFCTLVKRGL